MYDFESGNLSLDFANTMDWHGSQKPTEKLRDYTDLVSWGKQVGLISAEAAHRLVQQASRDPRAATDAYKRAIQLREAIYRIFSSFYDGENIPGDDLEILNSTVRQAMAHLRLSSKGTQFQWEWSPEIEGSDLILWPIARSAAELLTSDSAKRVRECEDDRGCGYLFIDQSKNHSRRWCSMESCGNRAKARRHYSRSQVG